MSEKAMGEKEIKGILADLAQRFMEAISSWDDVVFIGVRSGACSWPGTW